MKQNKTATATKLVGFVDTRSSVFQINPALVECVTLTGGTVKEGSVVAICLASGREIYVAGFGGDADAVENCVAQLHA